MGITMQNHGGYTETYDNFPENYYKVGRSYTDANQYLSLVHESDEAVKNLISYFSKVDDPVEIISVKSCSQVDDHGCGSCHSSRSASYGTAGWRTFCYLRSE